MLHPSTQMLLCALVDVKWENTSLRRLVVVAHAMKDWQEEGCPDCPRALPGSSDEQKGGE